jgi:catechol 2,3-dioxygenase-like lactoylglutathione lyase family enzyme
MSTSPETTAKGSYFVLRVPDIDRCAEFYRLIGLPVSREQHGSGPVHYSFPFGSETVCELYPVRGFGKVASAVRLGFVVPDIEAARAALSQAGVTIMPGSSERSFVALDPSGNQVEISQA